MFTNKALLLVAFMIFDQTNFISSDCVHGNLYPHSSSCRLFYQCAHGQLFELHCPDGLYFNPAENWCDWPRNVNCDKKTTQPTPTTITPTTITTTPTHSTTTEITPSTPALPTTISTTPTTTRTTTTPTTTTITTTPTTDTTPTHSTTTEITPSTPALPEICQWEPGQEIVMGNRCQVADGFFVFQFDGNAVIYDRNNVALWNTETAGTGHQFVFQTDGNLVMYSISGTALWNSRTHDQNGILLIFQQDRNLVIYRSDGVALWNAGTHVP